MSKADAIPLPAVLARRLAALGIDSQRLLREAGLPPSLFSDARPTVNTAGFFGLWRALERITDDPGLGLRVASEVTPDQFDLSAIAAVHADSVGDAFDKLARYKRLVCPEDVRILQQGNEVVVEFRWLLSPDSPPPMLIDACFASLLQVARYGTGVAIQPLRVHYARPERHRAVLQAHFNCSLYFDAASDHIVFARETLAHPFRTRNPDLLAVLLPGLEAALPQRAEGQEHAALLADVRAVIHTHMQGKRPTVDVVARACAMSSRSLQRKLGEAGTSYQRLLDEVRQQSARQLLDATQLESGEIAFLLGFEELNSFNRAFAAWEGTTPMRWRQKSLAGQDLGNL